ncbi:MAG: endo-1,4-beta-xylanase [Cyclobacteriaceae bacterium]|nr:endo-1,4-beta-xylanase [Cyclobacteriaceae bacterium]
MKQLILFIFLVWFIVSCNTKNTDHNFQSNGLKDYYASYFPVGVAISAHALKTDEAQFIRKEFNSLTAENAMKMGPIHPAENTYFWDRADSIVNFAQQNNMKLRGHTLLWHNQVPNWLFVDARGDTVSKEVLFGRLKAHITTIVSRYKGKIYAWDVVNEAISDSPNEFYRQSPWYKICGEEYISKAFEYAHEADPDALLFYNDYNEMYPDKREKIFKLIKDMKERGIPVHGLGMQAHLGIYEPVEQYLDSALIRFSQLGIPLHITELDISVYAKEHGRRERTPEDDNIVFTQEMEQQQMEMYARCFELFRKHKDAIESVTFWNISDRRSWLDNFPVRNRKDYPLLFDKDLQPKKAYEKVVNF